MKLTHLIGLVLLTQSCSLFHFDVPQQDNDPLVVLHTGSWAYRYGDSPVDSSGTLLWTYMREPSQWRRAEQLLRPGGNTENSSFLWLRNTLPQGQWQNPALYIANCFLMFEVYVDTMMVFRNGELRPSPWNKFQGARWFCVPLPDGFQGKQLSLRIFCSEPGTIGIVDQQDSVMVGREADILKRVLHTNIESVVIGFFFIFLGVFSTFTYFRRFKKRTTLALTFGLLAVTVGIFYVTQNETGVLLINSEVVRYYLGLLSLFVFPIWLYRFIEQIIELAYKNVLRRVWQTHALITLISLGLDLAHIKPLGIISQYYLQFFVVTIVITIIVSIRAALAGNTEIRLLLAGFCIFGLFGINDILFGLGVLTHTNWLSHWGALIFFSLLGYILERRFAHDQTQLEAYSRDLESISERLKKSKSQLEEYSQLLEEKVQARTQDLEAKNRELRQTLHTLRETQNQLVLKEKMASLGNLVAGVAHEVNNPIGAVCSAADVSRRCIERIKESFASGKSIEELNRDRQFLTSLRLLEENNAVTNMATERVSRIVRSLKNFARLDEAELQDADLHEGLESTLTLLHHELKNRITVEKDYGDLPLVKCLPNQLNQVFMNLIMNAAQAIDDKGKIKIKTFARKDVVVIEISDSGRGIAKEKIDKIFDPGFTTKGVGVGTGLGLSISYNIIQKHRGKIEVESEVGKGTTFRVILPVVAETVSV